MSIEQLLNHLLVPRPNGSRGLEQVAAFIEATLRSDSADVMRQTFTATPYGFQLLFAVAFLLMLGCAIASVLQRFRLALLLACLVPVLLIVETEGLWSPVSGLLPRAEDNIVATFPGRAPGPTLIFSAHYDTATQFGDHFTWSGWGLPMGAALVLAVAVPLAGLWRRRRRRHLAPRVVAGVMAVALVPFGAMAWFFTIGPLVRAPSPGALDNGGSVAVLLGLAERLAARPIDAATTVKLVFLAAEEERAFGSRYYAARIASEGPATVINLELMGASDQFAYVAEERSAFRSYRPSASLVALVEETVRELWSEPLLAKSIPPFAITDARSFLAHGIPAVTLMAASEGGFPRRLHSAHDSRERLSVAALERSVALLTAVVARVDRDPDVLSSGRM